MASSPLRSVDFSLSFSDLDDTMSTTSQTSMESSEGSLDLDWLYRDNSTDDLQGRTSSSTIDADDTVKQQSINNHPVAELEHDVEHASNSWSKIKAEVTFPASKSNGRSNALAVEFFGFDHRFVQSSLGKPAPFTEKHVITESRAHPFLASLHLSTSPLDPIWVAIYTSIVRYVQAMRAWPNVLSSGSGLAIVAIMRKRPQQLILDRLTLLRLCLVE
jgi:hypothetical protein